jgi:hypothetical protein
VDVRIELQIRARPLKRHDRAALAVPSTGPSHLNRVECKDSRDEDPRERREQRTVVTESLAPGKGQRQHPLAQPRPGGRTSSIRFADVAHILRPKHDGQNPRPLHEKLTSRVSAHP